MRTAEYEIGTKAEPVFEVVPPSDLILLAQEHLNACAAAGCAVGTLLAYKRVQDRYLAFVQRSDLGALNLAYARAWLLSLRADHALAERTIRLYVAILKVWGGWLEAEGYYDDSPLRKLKLPRVRQPVIEIFTPAQVRALVAAAAEGPNPERDVAVIYWLLDTMVRSFELCGLRLPSEWQNGGWLVVLGKGSKQRRIHYEPETAAAVARYLATRTDREPWLFLSSEGSRWKPHGLWRMLRATAARAGITGIRVSPHSFRHTGAVRFLQAHPGHIAQLRARLGHETLAMTLRYATRADEEMVVDGESALRITGLGGE